MLIFLLQIVSCLKVDESRPIKKVAFGSCANQFRNKNPAIFYSIASWQPDLFIWLGDIIYADHFRPLRKPVMSDLVSWEQNYQSFKSSPEYQKILEVAMVTGVWDDHDYGINDGDKTFTHKEESKSLLMQFLDDGSHRNHPGVYHSFTFKDVQVILIDIRWFRDSKKDLEGDSVGEEQWVWLEEQLKVPSRIKIIGNGLQINTNDRGGPAEKWHKKSRDRLMKLIENIPGVILLSGDVHYGEIMKIPCQKFPFFEVTSSGLTHSVFSTFNWIGYVVVNFFHSFNWNIGPKFLGKNFGTLEFDWENESVDMAIRNSEGQVMNHYTINFAEFNQTTTSPTCFKDLSSWKNSQILSSFVVFLLPVFLYMTSLIIYLRKLSNSY